jgi:hypothetical protein
MATTSTSETTFTVRRLNVAIPDVRGFQRSYEAAVPEVPQEQVSVLVQGVRRGRRCWRRPSTWTYPRRCCRAEVGLRQPSGAVAQAVHQQIEQAITLPRLDCGE